MAKLWSILRGGDKRTEKRDNFISIDDWAMSFQGNTYPIGMMPRQGNHEVIESDFEGYVRGAYKSSGVVFACMVARQAIFCEARFQFQRLGGGGTGSGQATRPGELFGNTDLAVLENPWPNGKTSDLLARAIQDVDLAGNFFAVEEPINKRIRRLRPDWVDIVLTAPPEDAVDSDIAGYIYKPGGYRNMNPETWEIYPIDGSNGKVAHWAPIPDPSNQYMGMSWLTPVMREIQSDKAATLHKGKFFENAATPNLAVSFGDTLTVEQFKSFMEAMDSAKGGVEHAYETLYLGGGAKVEVVGSDLRQLDFKATQGAGETRIAAAAQIPVVIVGFSEGMQGSSLNAGNYNSAKKAFGDRTLRPLWRSFCSAMEAIVRVPPNCRLWYDDRDISFLRTDRKELADIQHVQQQTITGLVMNGFTWDSTVAAVLGEDYTLLKHTGLFSVQLYPPGTGAPPKVEPNAPKAPPAVPKAPPKRDQISDLLLTGKFDPTSIVEAVNRDDMSLLRPSNPPARDEGSDDEQQ